VFFLSEEKPRRDWIFPLMMPAEICIGLSGVQYKYKVSKAHAILLMITEGLYKEGLINQEDYEKLRSKYSQTLIENLEKETLSINVQVKTAKVEVKKSTIEVSEPKKRPDYSKMSLEELEKLLNHLRDIGDTSEAQFVAFAIKQKLAEKGVKT